MFDQDEFQEDIESADSTAGVDDDAWGEDVESEHGDHVHAPAVDTEATIDDDSITFGPPEEFRTAQPGQYRTAQPADRWMHVPATAGGSVDAQGANGEQVGKNCKDKCGGDDKVKDKKPVEGPATERSTQLDRNGTLRTAQPLTIDNLLNMLDHLRGRNMSHSSDITVGRGSTPAEQGRMRLAEALAAAAATAGTHQNELQGPVKSGRKR